MSQRNTALLALNALAFVVLSYFFFDRALAELIRPKVTESKDVFVWLTFLAKPWTAIASIALAVAAFRAVFRGVATPLEQTVIAGSVGVLAAGVFTFELKEVFGRTWPETWVNNNPSYFGTGVYGFFPFHGGSGYASFPSGHMTAISAFAGAIAIAWPKLRLLSVAAIGAVAIGLLGASFHWLSDIAAGTVIGLLCANVAMAFLRQEPLRAGSLHQSPDINGSG